jgi:DNA ligase-1
VDVPFSRLAELGERLSLTNKRGELADLVAQFLRELAPAEIPAAVRLTIGHIFPEWDGRTLNLSWKALMSVIDDLTDTSQAQKDAVAAQAVDGGEIVSMLLQTSRRQPPDPPPLTILDVYRGFEQIAATSGRGSRARKEAQLKALLARSTAVEAKYLAKVIWGEMRHGVSEGVMLDGIARSANVKVRVARRANQLWGDLGEVALIALTDGQAGLERAALRLFRPVKPMLAQTANDLDEVFQSFNGRVALEYKLDGARVQIHCDGDRVEIYSRNLANVTSSLPDVVSVARDTLTAHEAILEGEVVAVDREGRPLPFQHVMRRFRRRHAIASAVDDTPVHLFLFDALFVDGRSLIDTSNEARWKALQLLVGGRNLVRRLVPDGVSEGKEFAEAAYKSGHEGVMAKDLGSPYNPGVRGGSWLKLKHVISLDLVIVAADWGYGRRHGWLSNYHLAARDEETGEYHVVGKTFKGLTDAQFQAMTKQLLALEQSRQDATVFVRPKVVVEVLFNEIQASQQYDLGLALRFARISRLRDDKPPAEADTTQTLKQLFAQQFEYKGRKV